MRTSERGAIGIYLALTIVLIITSSIIIMNQLASREISQSNQVVQAEQAFYAANTGLEELLFTLNDETSAELTGEIDYDDQSAFYRAVGSVGEDNTVAACACGRRNNQVARLFLGSDPAQCALPANCDE